MSKFMVSRVNGATTQAHALLNWQMSSQDIATWMLMFAVGCLAVVFLESTV